MIQERDSRLCHSNPQSAQWAVHQRAHTWAGGQGCDCLLLERL